MASSKYRINKIIGASSVKEIMIKNEDFESLINFKGHNFFDNEKLMQSLIGVHDDSDSQVAKVVLY